MSHREGRLESRVPFDGLVHRKVVQLVCKQNPPDRVKVSRSYLVNEQLVLRIDVGGGEAILPLIPIHRVVSPHNRLQVKRIGNRTNAVLQSKDILVT